MTDFPSFLDVTHPSFRVSWLLAGLDRLFAMQPAIREVHVELWGVSVHDDQSNIQLKGGATFRGPDEAPYIDEELLDEVPAVRLIERRAHELWDYVPLTISDGDEGASVGGEYAFVVSRGSIRFTHEDYSGMGHHFALECVHDGERWVATETLRIPEYDGSASDLLVQDKDAVLGAYSPREMNLKELPQVRSVALDEDGCISFDVEPGELTRCMGQRDE